jgi:hypothetical protein
MIQEHEEEPEARFEEGMDVRIIRWANSRGEEYQAIAYEHEPDEVAYPFDEIPVGTFEIISIDWERGGFVYNLRYNGEAEGHDYIRVWEVEEEDLTRVRN